jgi:hypothetical protein
MEIYDLYGLLSNDIERLANDLEHILGIQWSSRHSLYLGDYYKSGGREENFILQYNFNDLEEEWIAPDFKEYPILLYVTSTRASEIETLLRRSGLQSFVLLQRKTGEQPE